MLQSDIVIILDLSWTKFFQPSAFALEKYDTLDDDVEKRQTYFFGMKYNKLKPWYKEPRYSEFRDIVNKT